MDYSAVTKENLSHAIMQMNFEDIRLSEMLVTKRQILYASTYMSYLK